MVRTYRRRSVLQGALSATALTSLSGCVGELRNGDGGPVRFGVVLPLSGSLERIGNHCKRATEQAVADVNQAGGILGRPVELSVVDSQQDPDAAVEGYRSLVEEGIVGLVGGLISDVSLALAPEAAAEGVMEVSPASTSPALSDAGRTDGRKYFGRAVPNDLQQAIAMAKILDADQYVGADSVALLAIDNSFGDGLTNALREGVDADVVADVRYDPTADSFDGVLDEVFANDPDAVGFTTATGQETGILDAYAASEYDVPWVFSTGLLGGDIPDFYEGFYSASLSSSQTEGYFHLTQQLSDITPLAPFSPNAYDSFFLMAAAAEMAGEVSGAAIADNIRGVSAGNGHTVSVGGFDRVRSLVSAGRDLNYQGASSGVDLTANLETLSPYLIKHVQNGEPKSVELLKRRFFESRGGQ